MSKKYRSKISYGLPILMTAALLLAACGSSDSSTDAAKDADTTIATTAAAEVDDSEGDSQGDDEGDVGLEEGSIEVDEEFCESLPADTFSETVGGTITDTTFMGGGGIVGETSFDSASCTFKLDNGSEVVVGMLMDPETGSATGTGLFEAMYEESANDTFGGYEHEDVAGIGEEAFFQADSFNNKLMISMMDMVFVIEGKDADFEALERPVIQQIGQDAFSSED